MRDQAQWSFDVKSAYDKLVTPKQRPINVYFENYYPGDVPQAEIDWIMASVLNASEHDQILWWQLVELWANETEDQLDWRRSVYETFKAKSSKSISLENFIKHALKIFAGTGMQFISSESN